MTITPRPVAKRASRIASMLAVVAERVNCQRGSPNLRPISSATQRESSTGSMNCTPRVARAAIASVTAGGA
jgi:hypothetical protein